MTKRERLIELIIDAVNGCAEHWAGVIAERLLENGVIVLPCKVGDTVYHLNNIYKGKKRIDTIIVPLIVDSFVIGDNDTPQANTCDNERNEWNYYQMSDFGRYVFLTKEEAEQTLKGGAE